ncbi:MAG: proteic killer suppression protein [Planctomycetota bacterium]|jgi:proteic killer suppression protein
MIESFKSKETEHIFNLRFSRKLPHDIQRIALRRLRYLHAAKNLNDLKSPPGNELEALKGDRKGQYSIRINRQWRICFTWSGGHAHDVEIVDYH